MLSTAIEPAVAFTPANATKKPEGTGVTALGFVCV
jgi:hypothetical protein